MAYRLTRRARRDVLNIWVHIADEIRPGYRGIAVGEYLIFYRVMEPGVRLMHVVHGRRDLRRYLFD